MGYDKSIYRKIFDMADSNLKQQGEKLSYSYKAFSVLIGKAPEIVRADEFARLDKDDYLTAVYLRCLNRLPDENSYKMYNNPKMEAEALMKYRILLAIVHSAEFAVINKTVTGMKKLKREWIKNGHYSMTQILWMELQPVKAKCFSRLIVPIWIKMPNNIKNILRRITGRKSKPE